MKTVAQASLSTSCLTFSMVFTLRARLRRFNFVPYEIVGVLLKTLTGLLSTGMNHFVYRPVPVSHHYVFHAVTALEALRVSRSIPSASLQSFPTLHSGHFLRFVTVIP